MLAALPDTLLVPLRITSRKGGEREGAIEHCLLQLATITVSAVVEF